MKIIQILWLLTLSALSYAQRDFVTVGNASKKLMERYTDADFFLREKQPEKAMKAIEKAIEMEPTFIDAHFWLAEYCYKIKDFERSEKEYNEVVKLSADYKPSALFTLGLMAQQQKRWDDAINYYNRFLALQMDKELIRRAYTNLKQCKFRKEGYANPVDFSPQNMGAKINSAKNEYLAAVSVDGNTLIYTVGDSARREDFYMAKREEDGTWGQSAPIKELNTVFNEGAQTLSGDGKTLIFGGCNRPDGLGRCDLYISELVNGTWTEPRNMGAPINSKNWEGHSSISADGQTLYISSDRPEGNGGEDIWVSNRRPDGSWSVPTVLPPPINTPKGERSPFIHPDGVTLYFSSDGHSGFGNSDMFMSRRDSLGRWSEPINLGYPINTEGTDWSLLVMPDGETAIFSSVRPDSYNKSEDLYSFQLPENVRAIPTTYVRGLVKDDETQQPLKNVQVVLRDVRGNKQAAAVTTDSKGEFLLALPTGKDYGLNVSEKAYLFYSDYFGLFDIHSSENPFLIAINLQKAIETPRANDTPTLSSKPIVLKNVFFATNSADLKPESREELNRLKELLDEYPSMRIQINGHTDSQGSDTKNMDLSQRRAESVKRYLIEKGIDERRLVPQGFGKTQPIDTNATEQGRKNNRRTEFMRIP